ncbi:MULTISPECIES: L-lactate permease [unclassified Streptomyces]|uniref:L-lactate permease n=1 Tax=unclassified Streptomyces TaxID=2593676 RepID=UPI002DDB96E4|nr:MULTISPECIES: L-lactate permease [unclassified Streptomyces]WSA91161.1 L-lactate permease [Streptomyces sp. NBC_01795]WSB75486.1 L-lactate permease [Streptomyces sp. NBC_01775]WSS16231.1 L-lactate permease [Streptomyces sp. NBC_01186]WSS45049.1 L-lactate permease [Streptomyces sp. NBC_01187]
MYRPDLSPVADSLALSSLVGALPLLTLFVLLGGLRLKAHWAGLAALGVSVVVAVTAYGMPLDLALLAGTEGAAFGLFPIMWIVLAALWVYQLTVVSGRFEDLRRSFNLVSGDPRVQALIIAFCFGALLEALAGFGAPVAITGVMLMALGFSPVRAAVTVLVANTAPVAFGAIATPIITAGSLTKIDYEEIGAYVGRQTPVLALFVPLLLVALVDGVRGIRQTWPVALVCGAVFAAAQFVSATWISVELTDIIASLAALAAVVGFLRVWRPVDGERVREDLRRAAEQERREAGDEAHGEPAGETRDEATHEARGGADGGTDTGGDRDGRRIAGPRVLMAFVPYLIVIAVFSVAKLWDPAKEFLADSDVEVSWPGLDGEVLNAAGERSTTTVYVFPWLSSPGSLLLLCGLLVAAVYRVRALDAVREFGRTVATLRWALLTVGSVLALAYVMNLSGQTITIGTWIAGAGAAFAFFSPLLGWLGTAVTGSDTSANALFATLQQTAAGKAGLDPTLLVAANTSGGVVGKMISPQNLTIAATAVGLVGKEAVLFRRAIAWSLLLLLVMCVLVFLQSHMLAWMLP